MTHHSCKSERVALFLRLLLTVGLTMDDTRAQPQQPPSRKEARAIAQEWSQRVVGKHYYLNSRRAGLLKNDEISVVRCKIRYSPSTDLDTGVMTPSYRAKLWFEGVLPAPPIQFRLDFDDFSSVDRLLAELGRAFSPTPLEDEYDWPPEVKRAVRYRYIALGMDKSMVDLALGGVPYQVDLEKLDDGRVRETWKIQVRGDTRRIFTQRAQFLSAHSDAISQAFGTFDSLTLVLPGFGSQTSGHLEMQGAAQQHTTVVAGESGFFAFSGLPPQFLNITFTDGRATARRTEFVK